MKLAEVLREVQAVNGRGRLLSRCADCGGNRTNDMGKPAHLRGTRNGKSVPLCRPCKAKPRRQTEAEWHAALTNRFWFRRFPERAAAGFHDALTGALS